jgi:hypothetical protein
MRSLTDQLKPLASHVRVVIDDDETQRRLIEALGQARAASRGARANGLADRHRREAQDNLLQAATSLRMAAKRAQRRANQLRA